MSIGRQMLAALPGAPLSLFADWARLFTGAPDSSTQLDALRRAELEAKVEIRAVLQRLAGEFDIPGHEVDEAMAQVGETLSELTDEIENDLVYDIEHADQY